MKCTLCKTTAPFDDDIGASAPCIFCKGDQEVTASEILANPSLGVVREQRIAQVRMTQMLEQSLEESKHAIIEAGTGVGKSFAYLLPHILSGKRTVVATTKKALQRQLLEKDLPYLKRQLSTLGIKRADFKYSAIFGKSNYICYEAVKKHKPKALKKWEKQFFATSAHGIDTDVPATLKVTQDIRVDHCKGLKCPSAPDCGYLMAKREANEANILVTNHSYLGADLNFRMQNRVALLKDYDALVIDEAHALDDQMRNAFTLKVNKNSIQKLIKAFDAHQDLTGGAEEFTDLEVLEANWDALFEDVKRQGKGTDFALTEAQCLPIINNLNPAAVLACMHVNGETPNDLSDAAITVRDTANDVVTTLRSALYREGGNYVTHLAYDKGQYEIHVTPIKMRSHIQRLVKEAPTSFVSATLAVAGSLAPIIDRYGLDKPLGGQLGSPFDMRKQAMLYIPENMVVPVQKDKNPSGYAAYIARLSEEIDILLTASKGHAFVLFSARQEMEDVYLKLRDKHTLFAQAIPEWCQRRASGVSQKSKRSCVRAQDLLGRRRHSR